MTTGWQARRRGLWGAVLVIGGLALGACIDRNDERQAGGEVAGEFQPAGRDVKNVPVAELGAALRARLDGGARPGGMDDRSWRRTNELYRTYGDRPLWLEEDGLGARARALLGALAEAESDALPLDSYPLADLHRALEAADARRPSAEQLAEAEVLMSSVYVLLTEDLITGHVDPNTVSQAWHIEPSESDVDSALVRSFRRGDLAASLAALRPQGEDYQLLRRELQRFRQLVAAGGWGTVPGGENLKPGDPADPARLQALVARLQAEGFLGGGAAQPTATPVSRQQPRGDAPGAAGAPAAPGAGGNVYTPDLAGAVAAYQARHGIVVDSILGGETVESMNLPADYRLGQIAANLERQRWLPRQLGSRYVYVNVPAFELHAFEGGQEALNMRVVVGAEYNDQNTPAFADSMSYVVFRPYWNVPDNIADEELWPKVAEDPGYLERRNYEVVEENGKRRIRQKPGEGNALGDVKFMFPNDFAIYLHDTPEDDLFERDVRAFSHGCIRLEKPAELAQWVLGWDAARVRQAMESGPDDQQVTLDRKVPVYIVYFTAYAKDGQLYFGNDLYQRDDAMIEAVGSAVRPSEETRRTVEALRELVD